MLNYENDKWEEPRLTHRDFKAFFEATNQAMFVENRDGYVVSLNDAACELWGANYSELAGKHASEVLPPKLGTCRPGTVRRSRYVRPDHTTIEVNVLSTPLTLGDEEAFLTTVWPAEDAGDGLAPQKIDELPAPEVDSDHSRLQGEKMEALERFADRVSHDFNNIMTSVIGFGSLMSVDDDLSETHRGYVQQIIDATRRAEKLTGELIAFGHPSPCAETATFDPAQAIRNADPKIREILGGELSLSTLCEEEIPSIAGSEEIFAQILTQLATNTSEAMEGSVEGGLKIELGCEGEGAIVLRVSDDGPGMDDWSKAAAFEPFFTSRNDHKMRGLGLARVYAATRNTGGKVELRSEHGGGTEFTFTWPAAKLAEGAPAARSAEVTPASEAPAATLAAEAPAEPKREVLSPIPNSMNDDEKPQPPKSEPEPQRAPKPNGMPRGNETILVVEDEPMVREIVVRSLSHLGYTVHKACDGQEGLERSRELDGEVDLIFSDIVMPGLSGPEMVQKIREEQRNTPVLFTTGFTESRHLLENGGDLREGIDLLPKPYTPDILAAKVREKLDSLSA